MNPRSHGQASAPPVGRVLFSHPSTDLYGSDRMLLQTVLSIRAAGNHCVVVLPEGLGPQPLRQALTTEGIEVVSRPTLVLRKGIRGRRLMRVPGDALRDLTGAVRLIRRLKPDLVYINTLVQPMWMVAARLARTPSVCHVREAEEQLPLAITWILTAPLIFVGGLLCNSEATLRYLHRNPLLRRKRTRVVHNGKDWSGISRPPVSLHEGSTAQLTVIGRLSHRKGQDIAVDALAMLGERGITASMQLVGDVYPGYESHEAALRSQCEDRGVAANVEFTGFRSDIGPVLDQTTVLVVPSRIEPFGTVAAEGQAAGRVVVAADTGGLPEIVQHGITGLLFRAGDAADLADQLETVIREPAFAESLAREGQRHCFSALSLERYASEVLSFCSALTPRIRTHA